MVPMMGVNIVIISQVKCGENYGANDDKQGEVSWKGVFG